MIETAQHNYKRRQLAFVKRLRQALTLDDLQPEGKGLRWNQRDVLNTTLDYICAKPGETVTEHDSKPHEGELLSVKKSSHHAALIESSPGSGKTRMMGFIAKQAAHLNGADPKHKADDPVKVLIFTPRLDLNRQTLHEFDEELGIKDKDVALFDGNQNSKEKARAKSTPVLIATYQSLPKMLEEGIVSLDPSSPQYRGMVLMDEVHELVPFKCKPKGTLDEVSISSFVNEHQMTLLFTGTDDGVSQRHFEGKIPTIYSKRLVKAHNQGLTCDPIFPGLVDVSVEERTSADKEKVQELIDYFSQHQKVIEKAVDVQLTAEHPAMGYLKRYKSLFFVNGVEAGRNGKDYFNRKAKELGLINPKTGKSLEAAHIHSKTPKEERKRIIKDYKAGKLAAIFNDNILTFGFDDREVAVIHNLKMHGREAGARALAQMEQIFTRGTRICDGFSDKQSLDGNPYDSDKQSLLLTYRPVDANGQPLNVLTSMDLLAGLHLDPKLTASKKKGKGGKEVEPTDRVLLDDLDLRVHFDFTEQSALIEEMQRHNRQTTKGLPTKTDDWGTRRDVPSFQATAMAKLLDGIEAEYESREKAGASGLEHIIRADKTIRVQRMRSASMRPICYHCDDIPLLADIVEKLPEKTDEWLLRREIPGAVRDEAMIATLDEIEAEFQAKEAAGTLKSDPIKREGGILRIQRMQSRHAQPIRHRGENNMLLPPLDLNAINYHVQIIHHAAQSLSRNGKLILAGFGENPDTGEKLFPLVEHFDIGDISGMVSAIIRLSPETHRNLYIPLAVFRLDLARGKKGSKADIVAVTGVVADFDDDAASEYISRLPFPPHYVLETSAERHQAFYLFAPPVLSDPASSVAARLQAYAKCDYGTADISHVWRIPGTLNWPNSKKVREGRSRIPQLVRILEGGNHVVR